MANEPIAVAFVEIRPDSRGFKDETDAQVKNQLGGTPLAIPSELKVTGVEQAQKDIERVTRDVSTVSVPVQPDLSNFQSTIDDQVSAVATPVVIPGQLQLEGLGEAQVEAEELASTLTDVASAPLGKGVDSLVRELELARQQAELFSDSIVTTPTQGLGLLTTGFSDVGDSAAQATDGITDLSSGAGEAVSQLRYAVDVGEKFSRTSSSLAGRAALAGSAVRDVAGGVTQAVTTMRDGEKTVVNLGHGIFAQVQAFDALKESQLGLVQVAPNVSRSTEAQISSSEALTAARVAEKEAMQALVAVNTRGTLIGSPAGPGEIEATADVVQRQRADEAAAHQRLAAAKAEREAQEARSIGLQQVSEADAVLAVEEHARAEATTTAARADQLAADTGHTKATVDQERIVVDRQLVGAEAAAAEATLASGAAASTAAKEEGGLLRIRQRRAAPVGPFRLAGAGLGIGAAVFAGAQALGALSDKLRVTGDDAATFQGKMSNLGAALLSFDVAGAISALTNNTHTYQVEQLRLINQTPQLAQEMRDLGQATNLAKSATAALAGLSQTPQFLQTAITREETQGDTGGQIKTLTRIRDDAIRRAELVRQIGGSQAEINAALEPILKEQKTAEDQLIQLIQGSSGSGAFEAGIQRAQQEGDLPRVGELLEQRATAIRASITKAEGNRAELDRAKTDLKALTGRIDATAREINEATGGVITAVNQGVKGRGQGPLARDVVTGQGNQALGSVITVLTSERVDLQDKRAKLEARIADLKVEGANLKALIGQLKDANRAIEENAAALLAEEQRHIQENLDLATAGFETAALVAEAFGTPAEQIRALQAEALTIKGELVLLKALGPIAVDLYNQKLAQYIAINNQIEGIQSGITAENERHATEQKKLQDDAHEALVNGIGVREQKLLNARSKAEFSAALDNDIEAQQDLVRFYAAQSHNQKLTLDERRAFRQQFISAQQELKGLVRDERQAEKDQIREDIAAREDVLQDRLTLAKLNEKSTKDDEVATKKLIAFYRKQAHNKKLSRAERRDFLIKERQAEKDLRDLTKTETQDTSVFAKQQFEFLQSLQGFSTNLASNLIPHGATGGLVGGATLPTAPTTTTRAGPADRAAAVRPVSSAQGQRQIDLLRQIHAALVHQGRGQEHPEAHAQRKRGSAAMDYASQGTHGM